MPESLPDLYDLWDYNDPGGTRAKFQAVLPSAEKSDDRLYYLQLLTQIARTYSLEAQFDSSHKLLDTVESALTRDAPLVRVRYLLERGRTHRSAGDAEKALPLFAEAYEISQKNELDNYTVDAAHMLAIAAKEPGEKDKWNLIGIDISEKSADPQARKWLGSLYNNMGWNYHDRKQYEKSLDMFNKALSFHKDMGDSEKMGIARWCIAKTYRFLERIDEALSIQLELLEEHKKSGSSDGYVFEELGELYLLKADTARRVDFFARAYQELSKDTWLLKNEGPRLERLRKLGAVAE